MLGLIVGAALLGVIIAVMEEGEFPGWIRMIFCVLVTVLSAALINALLPGAFFFVGLLVGAIIGGFAISALCGMSVKRASIAAGIYLGIQFVISLLIYLAVR